MNSKLKKILKYVLIGLASILLLIFIIIGIAFNFVLTPEKITPKIVHAVNQQLDAELQIKSIELSFFSSFPNFSLELENGLILNQLNDSIQNLPYSKQDSLIVFDKGRVTVNPWAFLLHKKIDIKHIIFNQPFIYAYVDKTGKANWDIIKEGAEKDTITSEKELSTYEANIDFDDITITNGNLYYDDQNSDLYASLQGLNVELNAKFNKKMILLDMILNTDNLIFSKQGETIIDDLSFGITGKIDVNRKSKLIDLDKTKVRINDIEFLANGQLIRNLEKKEVDVQLDLALAVPSLKAIVELVPEKYLQKRKDFTSKGSVSLQAKINGIYGNGKFPKLKADLHITDGSIAYKKMSGKIDLIETDMSVFLDPSKETISFVNIPNFKIKGDGVDLQMSGKVDDALANTKVTAEAKGSLDFEALAKIFPLKKEVNIKGNLDTDINATFYPKDIENKNYGNIYALGKVSMTNVFLNYKNDSLVFKTKQSNAVFTKDDDSKLLNANGSEILGGRIDLNEIKLTVKNKMNIAADKAFFEFGTTPLKDKSQVVRLTSNLKLNNVHFNLNDTLKGMIKMANAQIKIKPSAKDKSIPSLHSEFFIDSTGVTANGSFFAITDGNYNLDMYRKAKKRWPVTGQITFNKLYAFTPTFPLMIEMPQTKITIKPGLLQLNHAKIKMGNSDLEISGKVYDLGKTIFEKENFKAELAIKSNLIDANELIATLNKGEKLDDSNLDLLVVDSQKVTTNNNPKGFVIPKRIDFRFNSSISKVLYKNFNFNNAHGLITIKDQTLDLANLQMMFKRAKMTTKVKLTAKENSLPSTAFDFKLADIDLKNLLDLMPVLDSLLPMSKSFDGDVNFRIRGISKLNENNGIIARTVDAIARIEGDNLVVMNSEVFANLSKKLMFKNKEKNIIDHISVEILAHNKEIEILPAQVIIDRYKFAIGGKHKFDMTYDYQFSILKSPLPFKAGVDIIGDEDDYKIKLTRAKYKYIFSNKKRHQKKVDSTLIKRKLEIIKQLPF